MGKFHEKIVSSSYSGQDIGCPRSIILYSTLLALPGKCFLPLRRKMNGASVRERNWLRWCKIPSASWPFGIHHLFSSVSPLVHPYISLATPVRFRDTAASDTQQPQRHSSSKSSTLFSNLVHSRTPGNKGQGVSI